MLESFASLNAGAFPDYFQELEGIAAGSLIPMQEARIWAQNLFHAISCLVNK